jgi:flagellin-like protein
MCYMKALSPVIAACILIAVTVAVSIAIASWMGSLTFNLMETGNLQIISLTFNPSGSIVLNVTNPGTAKITLQSVKVNKVNALWSGDTDYPAGFDGSVTITYPKCVAGFKYRVALVASDGTLVGVYEDTAQY